MTKTHTGKCLCGAVTYTAVGDPVVVARCHCAACRRSSGTGHSTGAMFASDCVTLKGALSEYRYTSDRGSVVTKAFCGHCGSPIFGRNTRTPAYLTLSLGTMDAATDLRVDVSIFERDNPDWDQLGEDAVIFQTQPDWRPDS